MKEASLSRSRWVKHPLLLQPSEHAPGAGLQGGRPGNYPSRSLPSSVSQSVKGHSALRAAQQGSGCAHPPHEPPTPHRNPVGGGGVPDARTGAGTTKPAARAFLTTFTSDHQNLLENEPQGHLSGPNHVSDSTPGSKVTVYDAGSPLFPNSHWSNAHQGRKRRAFWAV